MQQRILLALAVIVAVGGGVAASTGAFFSDTETSTGNTFAAGNIDLQIDNESYVTSTTTGALVASPGTSWSMKDLVAGTDKFFNFSDLKPGDIGEDTISIHVGSNNAWMCAAARITDNSDQTCTEPETTDEATASTTCGALPHNNDGDLAKQVNFVFWHDDGDNVFETGVSQVASSTDGAIFLQGPLSGIGAQGQITLADASSSILGGNTPIPGDTTFYIGKAWCFGAITPAPVTQDGLGKTGTNGPLQRGTGFLCNGAPLNNIAQTDQVQGDMQFYAVQSRNNPNFTCAQNYVPNFGSPNPISTSTPAV